MQEENGIAHSTCSDSNKRLLRKSYFLARLFRIRRRGLLKRIVSGTMLMLMLLVFSLRVDVQFEEWVPYVPDANHVELDYLKENDTSYIDISIEFPSTGYNVSDWGTPTIVGNNISADAEIWDWTGVDLPMVIMKSHTYSLGKLSAGKYLFIFKAWGFHVKNTTFAVPIIVPDDFPTIQEAINNATEGDAIYVRAGTYYENVVVNKTVLLFGEDRNTTIIDGGGNGTVVTIESANDVGLNGFSIRNSGTKIDNRTGFPDCGVLVGGIASQANSARILNNLVIDDYVGVYLCFSDSDVLRNNTLRNNNYNFGVDPYGHYHDIDSSNTVNGKPIFYMVNRSSVTVPPNAGYVAAIDCQEVVVQNLTLTNNWNGILFVHTDNSTIENVTVAKNFYGAFLSGSSYNVLRDNNLTYNRYNFGVRGGYLSHYIQDIDTSNTINGKPIYYLINKTKLRISPTTLPSREIGYLALVNSTEIIVENLTLTDNIQGLLFAFTTNSTIGNVTAKENNEGILLYGSQRNIISESCITNNWGNGIELGSSNENVLTLTNVENNNYGISIVFSDYNTVSNSNITSNSGDGVFMHQANHNDVVDNNITRNNAGIVLTYWSWWNTIVANEIRGNYAGIVGGAYSAYTSIVENNLINNTQGIGIFIHWYDVEIFHNNFVNNTSQVYAVGPSSSFSWDDGYPSGGNYWSDYNGTDYYSGPYQNETGSDGIGDIPFSIDEIGVDGYPLMIPWPLSDITITNITFLKKTPKVNEAITICVTVINQGNSIETFELGVNFTRLTDPLIGIQNVTLATRETKVLNFTWQPTTPSRYEITAYTNTIPNDVDPSNNVRKAYIQTGSGRGGHRIHLLI